MPLDSEEVLLELGDVYFYVFANLSHTIISFSTISFLFTDKIEEYSTKDFKAETLGNMARELLDELFVERRYTSGIRINSVVNLLLFTLSLGFTPIQVIEANMQKLIARKSQKKDKGVNKVISKEWPVDVLLYEGDNNSPSFESYREE